MRRWRMIEFEQLGLYRFSEYQVGNGCGAGIYSQANGEGAGPGGAANGDGYGSLEVSPSVARSWHDAIVRSET